jgi:selenoprotein W-related protein
MTDKNHIQVTIEYCKVCDFTQECHELKEFLNKTVPDARVECSTGRRGSFEVTINDTLVHSKLQTLAFPVHEDVAENVRSCRDGREMKAVKQQVIKDCCVM